MWYDPLNNYYAQHYYDTHLRWCYSPLYGNTYQKLIKAFTQKFLGWARLINSNYMSAGTVTVLVLDSTPREFYHNYLLKNHITFHQWVKKFNLGEGIKVQFLSLNTENGEKRFRDELTKSSSVLVFDPKSFLFKHPNLYEKFISMTSPYADFCWFLGITDEQTLKLPDKAKQILHGTRENSITNVFDCDQWKVLSQVFRFQDYLNFLKERRNPRYTKVKVQRVE